MTRQIIYSTAVLMIGAVLMRYVDLGFGALFAFFVGINFLFGVVYLSMKSKPSAVFKAMGNLCMVIAAAFIVAQVIYWAAKSQDVLVSTATEIRDVLNMLSLVSEVHLAALLLFWNYPLSWRFYRRWYRRDFTPRLAKLVKGF